MTPRARWLAALRLEPVDRLPFWPKIGGPYARAQTAPFNAMDAGKLFEWIGSDRQEHLPVCYREKRSRTSVETRQEGGERFTTYTTPHGTLSERDLYDEPSGSWHPVEFPVKAADDIPLMREIFEDVTVEFDPEGQETARARADEIGEDAAMATGIDISPLMKWVEHIAGIENAHFLLADRTGEVEALFDAMHAVVLRRAEIQCEKSPADMFYMIENTSTTLISPAQYRRYCFGHIMQYARVAGSHERMMVLHMCGHLKDILGDLAKLPVRAFEAFTSPTVGNTTLRDGREACPDKCLIGGTNAALWTRPAEEIIAQVEHDLDELPHHRGIVVTSAGVMPPLASPETIRAVCERVKAYPARM
jgi:uroporphyrinogen-III decarboxylase